MRRDPDIFSYPFLLVRDLDTILILKPPLYTGTPSIPLIFSVPDENYSRNA